ncbi:hypothetical protein Tco_0623457 [Tanacetum coccineum]
MLRWTCGKTLLHMIPNGVYRAQLEVETIINKMREGRLRWFRHVRRRPQSSPVRRVETLVVDSLRKRGRPKLRWEDRVKHDMKELLLSEDMTSDRNEWRARIRLGPLCLFRLVCSALVFILLCALWDFCSIDLCMTSRLCRMPCLICALSCLLHLALVPSHEWYKKPSFIKAYNHYIFPVPSSDQWLPTDYTPPLPPKARRMPGRPRKNQRRDAFEGSSSTTRDGSLNGSRNKDFHVGDNKWSTISSMATWCHPSKLRSQLHEQQLRVISNEVPIMESQPHLTQEKVVYEYDHLFEVHDLFQDSLGVPDPDLVKQYVVEQNVAVQDVRMLNKKRGY